MAITKNDCLLLLTNLKQDGVNVDAQIKNLLSSNQIPLSIIEFINKQRELSASQFYQKLRKSYNNKKSKLYINIVKDEFKDPKDILTTLASLNLQILLFSKTLTDNVDIFFNWVRFKEINQCLLNYATTKDLIPCQKLLKFIKADLKCLEMFSNSTEKIQ